MLDAGRAYNGGKPPETIAFGGKAVPNFRKDEPPITMLGREQKAWFKRTLAASTATWKIWGATNGTLDMRMDPQNLPAGLAKTPGRAGGMPVSAEAIWAAIYRERAELYDFIRDQRHRRVRHRIGGPAQLLGRLRGKGLAASEVRAGRRGIHHRVDLGAGPGRGDRARPQGPSVAPAVRGRAETAASTRPRSISRSSTASEARSNMRAPATSRRHGS